MADNSSDSITEQGRDKTSNSLSIIPTDKHNDDKQKHGQQHQQLNGDNILPLNPHRKRHRMTEKDSEELAWRIFLDLVYWKDPTFTFLWFLTVFLLFFLTIVIQYSIISIACYVIILQLVFSWVLMRMAPILAKVGILRGNFDPKTFALQRQAFSVDELRNTSHGLALM